MSADKTKEIGFGQAMERLEGILRRIEEEEVDIDELGQRLKEATQLIELCRGKIRKADLEVTQIVQALERPDDTSSDPENVDG